VSHPILTQWGTSFFALLLFINLWIAAVQRNNARLFLVAGITLGWCT